jgi:hypothetical protein
MVVSEGAAQEHTVTIQQKTTRAASGRSRGLVVLVATWVSLGLSVARAEPDDPAPTPPRATVSVAAVTPATVSTVAVTATPAMAAAVAAPTPATAASQFASQDRWEHAGYNQDEIVYTVFITNHEPNILRCRTEIHGFYFNNGQKGEISDVQVSTVFPDKQVQAGIWSGLDEASGATYKVSCRAL